MTTMIQLTKALQAWDTPAFAQVLKAELETLDKTLLPLQQGLAVSSYVSDSKHTAIVLGVSDDREAIRARVGIAYSGIVAGCSCADDPSPVDENPEYCVLLLTIDRQSGQATVALASEHSAA